MRPRSHLSAALVLLLFLSCGLFVAARFADSLPIDSDIVSLLPGAQDDPVIGAAIARANEVAAGRVALLIRGGDAAERRLAAAELVQALAADGGFVPALDEGKAAWAWAFERRDRLLCPLDRARLLRGEGHDLAQEALAQWYSGFSASNSALLRSDPLLLTPRFLGCLAAGLTGGARLTDAELVTGAFRVSVFRIDVQDAVAAAVAAWEQTWTPQGLTLVRAGAVFHAAFGAAQARSEMSLIGSVTLVLILALYLLVFRSLRPALLALLLVGCCLLAGLAAALALFGHVHVMVMVFAAALIGMVVDYTTYFLMTGVADPMLDAVSRRERLARPLTAGMATSVGGFAMLLAAPVEAFREIAVFGSVGLAAAWLAALYLLPSVEGSPRGPGAAARWLQRTTDRLLDWQPRRWGSGTAVAVTLAAGLAGWLVGQPLDDVQRFQAPSPQLAAEQAEIQALTGFAPAARFYLVSGDDREEATRREEALLDALSEAPAGHVLAASSLDPSHARQLADQELLRTALIGPQLPALQQALGLAPSDPYAALAPSSDGGLPSLAANLRGQTGEVSWSIVPLAGADIGDAEGWRLVKPAERYSALLGDYRMMATWGLVGAVLAIAAMLLLVYRRLAALRILLPMLLALILTPALTALAGLPFSFFTTMGLLLVTGAGVDYGIFQWERPAADGRWSRAGIALAATMTCVSIGLLGMSSVLPVMTFGVTVALGVFLSLALSPLARCGRKQDNPATDQGSVKY